MNSSNYNLYIRCCCWCFGNRCCLRYTLHVQYTLEKNKTSRWTETRRPTNFHTSMIT